MASKDKSFADLVAEAPEAPEGTVSLVGALAKSSEPGKFVLTLQDGSSVTLETSAVKGHTVLGASLGRTIVQVEVEAGQVSALASPPLAQGAISPLVTGARFDVHKPPSQDKNPILDKLPIHDIKAIRDHSWPSTEFTDPNLDQGFGTGAYDTSPLFEKTPIQDAFPGPAQATGVAPFALATPHQAPANVLEAMNPFGFVSHMRKIPGTDTNAYRDYVDTGGGIDVIVLRNF